MERSKNVPKVIEVQAAAFVSFCFDEVKKTISLFFCLHFRIRPISSSSDFCRFTKCLAFWLFVFIPILGRFRSICP